MDIQARKLNFIQDFLRLTNEDLILKFEALLKKEKQRNYEKMLQPMSEKALNEIIDKAEDDSENGRLTSALELKNEIDSWN